MQTRYNDQRDHMQALYNSSFTQRWHTHPRLARMGQTLGHHQWGCAALLSQLHPAPSSALLLAALFHDVGESETGDTPYNAKRKHGDLFGAVEKEAQERISGHAFVLSDEDQLWLKLVDRLESWMFVALHAPDLLQTADLQSCRDHIMAMARALGVAEQVWGVVQ